MQLQAFPLSQLDDEAVYHFEVPHTDEFQFLLDYTEGSLFTFLVAALVTQGKLHDNPIRITLICI